MSSRHTPSSDAPTPPRYQLRDPGFSPSQPQPTNSDPYYPSNFRPSHPHMSTTPAPSATEGSIVRRISQSLRRLASRRRSASPRRVASHEERRDAETLAARPIVERAKSTRRPQNDSSEDQQYREDWREREEAGAGFFDTRQRLRPDLSSMSTTAVRPRAVHPSSLSSFAPRAPLATGSANTHTRPESKKLMQ